VCTALHTCATPPGGMPGCPETVTSVGAPGPSDDAVHVGGGFGDVLHIGAGPIVSQDYDGFFGRIAGP